ncbi:hypothetical protein QUF79_07695 [Fictibacillus enclensis]|uniref:hypothetical protein n=1 Tax=Fictibacillus enclensis TaxID=1017270 RepID=UPI0025A2EBC0|nr:hypothetical protein [Fictibacillus enclensis]MDM5197897.1 hypothetical protein [Fictibacillus enclensis]
MMEDYPKVILLSEYKKKKRKKRGTLGSTRLLLRSTLLFMSVSFLVFAIFMWQDYKRTTLFSHNPNEIFKVLDQQDSKTLSSPAKEKISSIASKIEGLEYLAVFSQKPVKGDESTTSPIYVFSKAKGKVDNTLNLGDGNWHIEYKFKKPQNHFLWDIFLVVFIFFCFVFFGLWMIIGFKYPKGMSLASRMMYIK